MIIDFIPNKSILFVGVIYHNNGMLFKSFILQTVSFFVIDDTFILIHSLLLIPIVVMRLEYITPRIC